MNTSERGRAGEQLAADYLAGKGYQIVDRNYHCRWGELDLVAKKDGLIVFVEVKLRRDDRFSSAIEAVTYQKQRKLRAAASMWLAEKSCDLPARFDVVEVYTGTRRLLHTENAFDASI